MLPSALHIGVGATKVGGGLRTSRNHHDIACLGIVETSVFEQMLFEPSSPFSPSSSCSSSFLHYQ